MLSILLSVPAMSLLLACNGSLLQGSLPGHNTIDQILSLHKFDENYFTPQHNQPHTVSLHIFNGNYFTPSSASEVSNSTTRVFGIILQTADLRQFHASADLTVLKPNP